MFMYSSTLFEEVYIVLFKFDKMWFLPARFGPYYKKRMSSVFPKLLDVTSVKFSTIFMSIMDDLCKEYNLKRLVKKFKKASEIDKFRRRKGIYECTICRLASAKQFKSIEEILEDQKKYNDITKESFSARLIMLYGKSGMLKNARKLFEELPDRNCNRTVLSLNALLVACLHCKKFRMVDHLFRELPSKLSIEPNMLSYNTVIKAFCEMGSFDSAISMLDEMEKKSLKPDLNTFNTLLYGLYGNGRSVEAENISSQMSKKNVTADTRSFKAKLLGLAVEKKTKEAVALFEKMRNEGFQPDLFSINTLIKGFVNEGNLVEVKHWYSEIFKSKCAPDNKTFAILLPFLCEKGELRTAVRVCKDIFNCRHLVDPVLLQLVVDRLVKESMVAKAKKIVERGKSDLHCRYKLNLPSEGL